MSKNLIEEPLIDSGREASGRGEYKRLSFWSQLGVLTVKNLRIFQRKKGFFLFHLLVVLLIFGWMTLITYLVRYQSSYAHTIEFAPAPVPAFAKCGDSALDPSENCLTLGVVLVDQDGQGSPVQDWIQYALDAIRARFGLKQGKDVQVIYSGKDMESLYDKIESFSEIKSMVSFCNNYDFFHNDTVSVNCNGASYAPFEMDLSVYGVHFNYTRIMPSAIKNLSAPVNNDINAILLKKTIDESILNFFNEESKFENFFSPFQPAGRCPRIHFARGVTADSAARSGLLSSHAAAADEGGDRAEDGADRFEYDLELMDFPASKNRLINRFDSSSTWGSFFYMFIVLLSFTRFSQLLAQEKHCQLRKGLIPLGISHLAYWLSWLLCICVFDVLFSLAIILLGKLFGFPVFVEINMVIPFVALTLCLWSYRFLSILVTVFCERFGPTTRVNYMILVVSIFLQSTCCLTASVLLPTGHFVPVLPERAPAGGQDPEFRFLFRSVVLVLDRAQQHAVQRRLPPGLDHPHLGKGHRLLLQGLHRPHRLLQPRLRHGNRPRLGLRAAHDAPGPDRRLLGAGLLGRPPGRVQPRPHPQPLPLRHQTLSPTQKLLLLLPTEPPAGQNGPER